MSRVIKFRAWDTDANQYVDCSNHSISQIGNNYAGLGNRFNYQQFTGLTDKNGKEIYEGDIIQFVQENRYRSWNKAGECKTLDTTKPEIDIRIEKVEFRDGSFRIGYSCRDLSRLPDFTDVGENYRGCWRDRYYNFEIIGNIYEHPHLLNS